MEYLPGIEQVIPIWNYKVYVYMDDNTVRLYDAAPLIQKGGIFKKLQDKSFFYGALYDHERYISLGFIRQA